MAQPVSRRGEGSKSYGPPPRPAPPAGGGDEGGALEWPTATTGDCPATRRESPSQTSATPDSTPPQKGGRLQMKRPALPSGWPKVWGPSALPSTPTLAVTLSGSLRSTKPVSTASLRSGFDLSCP